MHMAVRRDKANIGSFSWASTHAMFSFAGANLKANANVRAVAYMPKGTHQRIINEGGHPGRHSNLAWRLRGSHTTLPPRLLLLGLHKLLCQLRKLLHVAGLATLAALRRLQGGLQRLHRLRVRCLRLYGLLRCRRWCYRLRRLLWLACSMQLGRGLGRNALATCSHIKQRGVQAEVVKFGWAVALHTGLRSSVVPLPSGSTGLAESTCCWCALWLRRRIHALYTSRMLSSQR